MHESYDDIKSRIAEPPKWYDSNGVPRYGDFHPHYCPDIYSHQVWLLRIMCQGCHAQFDVEVHADAFDRYPLNAASVHYGDPPYHGCTGGGDTMNCIDLAILQAWEKSFPGDWERNAEAEGILPCEE